ncbi:MAG: DUF1385 domain-containing protein [Candidatus Marinimicrobia bacterium]|nr:DUF1385 domain-containing protein [Candidatus Neomarinimicrobiota bacterium]MBL7023295.1 DUF1385 domain-containing protein [Candidatus Neomarinimicrobiota bacterium]
MKLIVKTLALLVSKSQILVGGQAVIEGVMMRVPGAYATAVRNPENEIQIDRHEFESIVERKPHLKKPILRGIVQLFEAMKIGFKTLQWSAEITYPEEKEKSGNKLTEIASTIFAIGLAIGLFFVAPIGLTTWLFDKNNEPFYFNIISGGVRIAFFLIYLILISLMKDVKRLFQYHGAEHQTIYAFESGNNLEISEAKRHPTQHPRCGTSFIFILLIVAILTFAVIDSFMMLFVKDIQVWMRLLIHLPMVPLVSGFGYEVLKLTAKYRKNILFRMFAMPGIWLQYITTKQPDDEQLEVAIKALQSAFGDKIKDHTGQKFVAEAIG